MYFRLFGGSNAHGNLQKTLDYCLLNSSRLKKGSYVAVDAKLTPMTGSARARPQRSLAHTCKEVDCQ
jgi:hypothetical protein